ncbi:unnamed protein product [Boreogadus saida]
MVHHQPDQEAEPPASRMAQTGGEGSHYVSHPRQVSHPRHASHPHPVCALKHAWVKEDPREDVSTENNSP